MFGLRNPQSCSLARSSSPPSLDSCFFGESNSPGRLGRCSARCERSCPDHRSAYHFRKSTMPLPRLVPDQVPAPFDVQETAFSYDVLGRYLCNTWEEVMASQSGGGAPFDVVVIGAGMYGGYCAEKLYRLGTARKMRILILEA